MVTVVITLKWVRVVIFSTQASRASVSFVGHTVHCGTESEHPVFNGSHIFISLREY